MHEVTEQTHSQPATGGPSGGPSLSQSVPPYSSSDLSDASAHLTQEAGAEGPRHQASTDVTRFDVDHLTPSVKPMTHPDAVRAPSGGVHTNAADDAGHLMAASVEADSSEQSAACCFTEEPSGSSMIADSTSPPSAERTSASAATPSVIPPLVSDDAAAIASRFSARAEQLKADLARARAIAEACTSAAAFSSRVTALKLWFLKEVYQRIPKGIFAISFQNCVF